jgi:hypothetical protein
LTRPYVGVDVFKTAWRYILVEVPWANSSGRRNTSMEVSDGNEAGCAKGYVGDARKAPLAGSAHDDPTRAAAELLERDREGCHDRGVSGPF